MKWHDAEVERHCPRHGMTVYHPFFIQYDQYVAILPNTVQNIAIAVAAMTIVAFVFIPHPAAAVLIVLSILSIDVGVVGIMSLWGVRLDIVSMMNLIICIGFAVDFSAHLTYAFMSSKAKTRDGCMKEALLDVGFPIVQGAMSTIIAAIPLVLTPSYIFRTFFKTMFLVIVFGFLHGFLILPVVLSLIGPSSKRILKKKESVSGKEPTTGRHIFVSIESAV
eukprot:m.49563 g.49563  ORF g.49563 m.49563 type:complete len:221 (+) comp34012_c0_seq1:2142-2804(+)